MPLYRNFFSSPGLELKLSASLSDDDVLNSELDADIIFFNEVYPTLAENRIHQYYTYETLHWLTVRITHKSL